MAVNPGRVYQEMLLTSSDLPADKGVSPELQRHILAWGKAHKDVELLACLQGYKHLIDDVDVELGALPYHQVQSAHVSRPGRDLSELSRRAKKDRRVAVHATLASAAGLDEEAYAVMAKSSSRSVAFPLIANRAAPLEVRRRAIANIAPSMSTANSNEIDRYKKILAEFPELAGEAFAALVASSKRGNSSADAARMTLSTYLGSRTRALLNDLDQSAVDHLMDLLSVELARSLSEYRPSESGYHRYHTVAQVREAIAMVATAATSALVSTQKRLNLLSAITWAQDKLDADRDLKNSSERAVKLLKETPDDVAVMSPARLYAETDLAVLLEVSKSFDTSSPAVDAVASAIISNPRSTAEVVQNVMNRYSRIGGLKAYVEVHRDHPDVIAVLLADNPWQVTDDVLSATSDPQKVIADLCALNPKVMGPRLATSRFMTRDLVGVLPVSYLETLSLNTDMSGATKSLVVSYITDRLGDDIRAWEMFEQFVGVAPGSIDQLLAQIKTLLKISKQ